MEATTLSEPERLATDARFRKLWAARARRTIAKATVSDVLRRTRQPLIDQAAGLKIKLAYPEAVQAEADRLLEAGETVFRQVRDLASNYSGNTEYKWWWADYAHAITVTDKGEMYSGKCTYRKTDAVHKLRVTVAGIRGLMTIPEETRAQSSNEGLVLISAERLPGRCAKAVWARGGKPLTSSPGFIAWEGAVTYHADTEKAARKGLTKKLERAAELAAADEARKNGVPPLFKPVVRVDEVRRFTGWCLPGCRQWIQANMGKSVASAPWGDVAQAALRDTRSGYGATLRNLLGVVENGPYTFAF
jgi:hypothetical protein